MRRAVVYRGIGDTELVSTVMDGMMQAVVPLNNKELDTVKAECAKLREENRRLEAQNGVRKNGDDNRWPKTQAKLAHTYHIRRHGLVYKTILCAWALMWFQIGRAYEYLSAINRGYSNASHLRQ